MQKEEMISVKTFNPATFSPYGYLDQTKINNIKDKINEFVSSIIFMYDIIDKYKVTNDFKSLVASYDRNIVKYISNFISKPELDQASIASQKENLFTDFILFHQNNLGQRAMNNNSSLLFLSTFVKSFIINENFLKSNNFMNSEEFEKKQMHNFNILVSNAEKSSFILEVLQKRTSETPVSDYAQVFKKEHTENQLIANRFLYCGIGFSVLFILSIILFSAFGLFEIVIRDNAGKLLYYNVSNLFTKVVLVAIQVFFISFCFKQYNVNKHLATLNKHRENALNSYKLFQASIIGNDNGSHNALMIQVAKSIYEHPQSTGFLNENSQQMQSGIVELTKIIGDNKAN